MLVGLTAIAHQIVVADDRDVGHGQAAQLFINPAHFAGQAEVGNIAGHHQKCHARLLVYAGHQGFGLVVELLRIAGEDEAQGIAGGQRAGRQLGQILLSKVGEFFGYAVVVGAEFEQVAAGEAHQRH